MVKTKDTQMDTDTGTDYISEATLRNFTKAQLMSIINRNNKDIFNKNSELTSALNGIKHQQVDYAILQTAMEKQSALLAEEKLQHRASENALQELITLLLRKA